MLDVRTLCHRVEGLGADTASEAEIVVILKMEMIACVQQRNTHFDKSTSKGGQKERFSPHANWNLKNGFEEEMTSVKHKERLLCSNSPFQGHKMEGEERMTSDKQKGWMPCSNTPFQSHKMEVKEKMTSVKQKGRMPCSNTQSKDYTRRDNSRAT